MRVYEVGAATRGQRLVFATCDTAVEALLKFRMAQEQYDRAWVIDGAGADVCLDELTVRADEERNHPIHTTTKDAGGPVADEGADRMDAEKLPKAAPR